MITEQKLFEEAAEDLKSRLENYYNTQESLKVSSKLFTRFSPDEPKHPTRNCTPDKTQTDISRMRVIR